jgi:hypothetical protein
VTPQEFDEVSAKQRRRRRAGASRANSSARARGSRPAVAQHKRRSAIPKSSRP